MPLKVGFRLIPRNRKKSHEVKTLVFKRTGSTILVHDSWISRPAPKV